MANPEAPVVLLVDDDEQFRYLIERYGRLSGCVVVHTSTDEATPERIAREHPALVVIDLLPPALRGWSLVRALRADADARVIPVAVCGTVEDEARAAEESVDCCLWKPLRYDDFVAALASVGVLAAGRRLNGGDAPTTR